MSKRKTNTESLQNTSRNALEGSGATGTPQATSRTLNKCAHCSDPAFGQFERTWLCRPHFMAACDGVALGPPADAPDSDGQYGLAYDFVEGRLSGVDLSDPMRHPANVPAVDLTGRARFNPITTPASESGTYTEESGHCSRRKQLVDAILQRQF